VQQLSTGLGVPSRLTQAVLRVLLNARLVTEVAGEEPAYAPARPLDNINVYDILHALRTGNGQELPACDAPALAVEADFRELFPDCQIGTMPPFGGLYGVEMLVDAEFSLNTRLAFEAGTHSDAIKMSYADFAQLTQPEVADFSEKVVVK